jgi:hypothetical protein
MPSANNVEVAGDVNELKVLQVAEQELSAGNKSGQVLVQLSKGAVAWPLDRPVAQARVSRKLQAKIEKQQPKKN